MAETVSELLPCPFCGGAPYVHQVDYCDPPEWAVLCLDGDCGGSHSTEAEAIAAWNRRPPDPNVVELVEAAKLRMGNWSLEDIASAVLLNDDVGASLTEAVLAVIDMNRALLAKHAAKP